MARDMTPVLKKCRALGIEPGFLGVEKKNNGNRHSTMRPKKLSEYGMQLKEKQKAKFIYGVLEKPFRNYFTKAQRVHYGTTGENLMVLLELRLDNVIFRLGLARTRDEAKQVISHRHVTINGKVVNIPSYSVKVGDVIEIKEGARSSVRYKDIIDVTAKRIVPTWLTSDQEKLSGKVVALPSQDQIDSPVNAVAIVELYSK